MTRDYIAFAILATLLYVAGYGTGRLLRAMGLDG